MIKEPLIAHSELTNEIYVVVGKEKYPVTEQAIKAVMATKVLDKEPILDKIRAEIEKEIIPRNSDQYDHEAMWQNCGLRMALKVIDKYEAESEK